MEEVIGMGFSYELVKAGESPTWAAANRQTFQNPVAVGDKVKPKGLGGDLLLIVAIEHYPDCSVLYYA